MVMFVNFLPVGKCIILGKKIKGKIYENQDEICIWYTDSYFFN